MNPSLSWPHWGQRTLCLAALLAPFVPLTAAAADLRVTVLNGPTVPSMLYIALFDNAEAFGATKPVASQILQAREGGGQIAFLGLPVGRYALRMFADENGNGKLDTNLLGLPIERYGFSNDARGTMGPPGFDAAAFRVDGDTAVTVHLR